MSTLSLFTSLDHAEQQARGLLFTPHEIAQQPLTWGGTLEIFKRDQQRIVTFLEAAGVRHPIEQRPTVMLVGAGTSDYVGRALASLLRVEWGCEVFACPSTTLLTNLDDYIIPGRRYLWISFSRSGDSPEGVAVLQHATARYPEIAQLVVTCSQQARMVPVAKAAALSCVVVLDDAVNDRSLVMTSSFTNMVVMGQCLGHAWSITEYEPTLDRLRVAAQELLQKADSLAERTASLKVSRAVLIGSGPLESVATESALKILEITAGRVKTMSETVLGLRHGPMAALDKDSLLVCFVSEDRQQAMYARDLLIEIGFKQIARERIVVGPAALEAEFAAHCDFYLPLHDDIQDLYRPVLDVIFGQLLGLYCSIAQGLQPDAPSPGGVISRVVQTFQIY